MNKHTCRILVVILSLANSLWSQSSPEPSETDETAVVVQPEPQTRVRPVTWKQLVPNIAKDQKHIWTFPVRLAQGKNWGPALGVSAITAGLVVSDPYTAPYFRKTNRFDGFNSVITINASALGSVIVPIGLYVGGMIKKDSYAKDTALLAGEAIANAQILSLVMHMTDRRIRPENIPIGGDYRNTWFKNKVSFVRGSGSFPSGHSLTAFSVATVVSRRYSNHRWVPYVMYGSAALFSVSRITSSGHFSSDVFFGAAVGYAISRYSVLGR